MKHIFSTLICTCGLFLAASCSSNAEGDDIFVPVPDESFEIVIPSSLGGISATSRAAIEPSTATSNLPVTVFRVDQTDVDTYPELTAVAAPYAAKLNGNTIKGDDTAETTPAKITFDAPQYYLVNGWKTSVLAVHPKPAGESTDVESAAAAWNATDNKLTLPIDGKTDIMATGWGVGYKNLVEGGAAVAVHPQGMTFKHLLAQVRIKIYGADKAGRDYWGNVESVTVTGREESCKLTLPAITAESEENVVTLTPVAVAEEEDGGSFPIRTAADETATLATADIPYWVAADPQSGEITDKNNAALLGHTMFAPTASAIQLPLTIVTNVKATGDSGYEDSESIITNIKVGSNKYEAGKAYTIVLKLSAMGITPEAVVIEAWVDATGENPIESEI